MSSKGDPGAESSTSRRSWSDLGPRLGSAFVLLPLTALSLYLGGYIFALTVGVVFAGAYREWEQMVARAPISIPGAITVVLVALSGVIYPVWGLAGSAGVIALAIVVAVLFGGEGRLWRAAGLAFFGLVIFALIAMRGTGWEGVQAGVFLAVTVWMTDSAAFFTGRQIGGEKLAPVISPSKTWSGALGGLALGSTAGFLVWLVVTDSPWWIGAILAVTISLLGQIGDLTESAIKRNFRIKDSGDIIPGHGGLMDRLDSLTFGVIFVLIVGFLHAGLDNVAVGLLHW